MQKVVLLFSASWLISAIKTGGMCNSGVRNKYDTTERGRARRRSREKNTHEKKRKKSFVPSLSLSVGSPPAKRVAIARANRLTCPRCSPERAAAAARREWECRRPSSRRSVVSLFVLRLLSLLAARPSLSCRLFPLFVSPSLLLAARSRDMSLGVVRRGTGKEEQEEGAIGVSFFDVDVE